MAAVAAQNPAAATIVPLALRANSSRKTKLTRPSGPPLCFGLAPNGASVRASPSQPSRTAIATGAAAPTMETKMKTFAEFQILGRIGKAREVGQTTRVSICANYAFKDRNGETKDKPYWNEITIWSESARKYVRDYAKPGDLVVARGTLKQGSFEKDGEKIYTVDLNCDDFSILASAKTDKSDRDEADAAPEATKKTAKRK
jgi:single-stranded DNA-binding protein